MSDRGRVLNPSTYLTLRTMKPLEAFECGPEFMRGGGPEIGRTPPHNAGGQRNQAAPFGSVVVVPVIIGAALGFPAAVYPPVVAKASMAATVTSAA